MIWLCGSGDAFGDAAGDAAGVGLALARECELNTIMKTSTTIASGANVNSRQSIPTICGNLHGWPHLSDLE